MGNFDWQTWVTLAIVAAAAVVICRRSLDFVTGRGRSACDDCSSKGTPNDRPSDGLVEDLEDWTSR